MPSGRTAPDAALQSARRNARHRVEEDSWDPRSRNSPSPFCQLHQVPNVLLQPNSAVSAQVIPSHRSPVTVGLLDRQVAGVLGLSKVRAETAICLAQNLLQPTERHRVVLGKQDADRESHPVLEKPAKRPQLVKSDDLGVSAWHFASVLPREPALQASTCTILLP